MSEIPGDLKFLKSHEWVRVEDGGLVTVGISEHAQALLGDLVYVELPAVGEAVNASDVYSPISGTVMAVNEALNDKPETINEDAFGEGWLFTLKLDDADQLNELLSPDEYASLIDDENH
jgi:glycine cleavage system H protein